jgi:hypothetical protein
MIFLCGIGRRTVVRVLVQRRRTRYPKEAIEVAGPAGLLLKPVLVVREAEE